MRVGTSYATVPYMKLAKALTVAMKAAKIRDEHVAISSLVSTWTIGRIRRGLIENPRPITVEALKNAVPGLAELLDTAA